MECFKQSDGWLLASLLCLGEIRKKTLSNIISTGDHLNHAVFTLDEINDGLSRLETEGYIFFPNGCLRVTPKAKAFNRTCKIKGGSIAWQVAFSEKFSHIPLKHASVFKKYFSSPEYKLVIEQYCGEKIDNF